MLEKTDVYTMGNVMYYVLTAEWLFEKVSVEQAVRKVQTGWRSPWPKFVLDRSNQNDTAITAMKKAIEMCWIHDPHARPKATQVRDYVGAELKRLLKIKGRELTADNVRIHSLQPFLSDYQGDDDAGYDNMLGYKPDEEGKFNS